jgi:hypothetical protein
MSSKTCDYLSLSDVKIGHKSINGELISRLCNRITKLRGGTTFIGYTFRKKQKRDEEYRRVLDY